MFDQRLQGWNAIAEFLNCDVRTAKRWETERGLPVRRTRRTPGEGRPNVYALVSEIHEWRARSSATEPPVPLAVPEPAVTESPAAAEREQQNPAATVPPERNSSRSRAWLVAIAIVCVAAAMLWARERRVMHPSASHAAATAPAPPLLRTGDRDVRNLYLHGTYLLEQRTPETLVQAKTDFEHAIAKDATFAPAYTGLAETYDLLREYSTLPSEQAYPRARQAAERAIALDPNLADAHAALGYEEFFWEWDEPRAAAEFKRAIALDPNSATAAHWYGAMLLHQARFNEAIEQLDRAQTLEPASASVLATRAYAIGLSGRRDDAVNLLQDILTRVPNAAPLHFILAQLCLQQPRDIPRYLDQMRRYADLRHSTGDLKLIEAGESAFQHHGEAAMWRAMLETEQRLHPHDRTYRMAALEAALGMNDAAISDLQLLKDHHNDFLIGVRIDSLLTPLHPDPRFRALERQVGLPDTPVTTDPAL